MTGEWVLLSYRLPREPSAPRVALWRRLKRLGVAQVLDGLVALPADARTREQLDWAADDVIERGGTAHVWLARPASVAQERDLARAMAADRAAEYVELESTVVQALGAPPAERRKVVAKARRAIREVRRRDFFPPGERDRAQAALSRLERSLDEPPGADADAASATRAVARGES
ncbi:Chromate resistance protein ChrB [Promicromonospora sp. NPDC019610]|uniref:Chromate resistance protein ChrB n=1 Tax=Promicromonospora sp. NPDC019610 TaxID=3364405 RepID=UPI00378A7EE6